MTNEYYILPLGMINVLDNIEIVEDLTTVRKNLTNTKFVCKTRLGIVDFPPLRPQTRYSHSEILVELSTSEWTINEF